MQMKEEQNNLLSTLFDSKNTLNVLTSQSNNLTKLTDEACFIGKNLNKVLIICDSELLTNAFSTIVKGINHKISISVSTSSSFEQNQGNAHKYDAIIPIVHDTDALKEIIKQCRTLHSKIFLIAPSSLQIPPLAEAGIDIAVALESNANDIRNAFLRGIVGERFCLGFSCVIEEKYAQLTPRQKDVLKLICNGKSNKEIARELNITLSTIKVHCAAIFKELGVTNRTQAAIVLGH